MITMWHGGRRWAGAPEVRSPKQGRYECGPGIYLTNRYERARKYAKGGGVVQKVTLADGARWLEDTNLPVATLLDYVASARGMAHKASVREDLLRAERREGDRLPVSYLVNLCVNHEAVAGKAGAALADWLAEQGIDASRHSVNAEEDWIVVFNPKIIRRHVVVSASTVTGCVDFPKVAQQF